MRELKAIQTQLAPITSLEQILPKLLSNLSLARAQIAIDQIRTTISTNSLDNLVYATASSPDSPETPVAAAIAVQQASSMSGQISDLATLIHPGGLSESMVDGDRQIIPALSSTLDGELRGRGVRFLQWATDVCDAANDSVSRWCQGFGFEQIGTLDYLGGDIPCPPDSSHVAADGERLRFIPVDWDQPDAFDQFANLAEATYAETLDCPRLAHYRTAAQTLRGYYTSSALDPNLWYFVHSDDGLAGCMILGNHRPSPSPSPANDTEQAAAVIEIVYMGLIPRARGQRRGIQFMQHAFRAAGDIGASRIILAVDQKNHHAREIYDDAGLQPMLSETVWVKSLDPESSSAN